MDAITYTEARNRLAATMDRVTEDHTPVIITRQRGRAVVMMSLEDFNAWQETAYLLRSPENARDLLEAVEDLKQRRGIVKRELLDDDAD